MSRPVYPADVDLFFKTTSVTDKQLAKKWRAFTDALVPFPVPVMVLQVSMTKADLLQMVSAEEYAELIVKAGGEDKLLAIALAGKDIEVVA